MIATHTWSGKVDVTIPLVSFRYLMVSKVILEGPLADATNGTLFGHWLMRRSGESEFQSALNCRRTSSSPVSISFRYVQEGECRAEIAGLHGRTPGYTN